MQDTFINLDINYREDEQGYDNFDTSLVVAEFTRCYYPRNGQQRPAEVIEQREVTLAEARTLMQQYSSVGCSVEELEDELK